MNENYKIKMENIIGDYYLCLGAFNNCVELYSKRGLFKINNNDSEEIKKIKQAQMNDLMSNLGKVGEKALKYIIALQKVKISPNEDLKSMESIYKSDKALKSFISQLGYNLENDDMKEIFDYKDYNNQKAHNFDYLLLIIERIFPKQFDKLKNYILYDIQSNLMKEAIASGKIDNSFSFIRAIIFPEFSVKCGFTNDEEKELPKSLKMNRNDYEVYRKIIKQSGDIFTRLRYYSNDPKDKDFNLDYIFKIIRYFVQYINIVHYNNDNLEFDLEDYYAKVQALNNSSLLYLSDDDIINIFNLDVDINVKEKLLFQAKESALFGIEVYNYKKVEKLIKLNLSSEFIAKIIDFNFSPNFVEFCLSNGIDDIFEMNYIYEQYICGKNVLELIKRKK